MGPDQKPMRTRCLGGFSVMWVTKLLTSPVKIRIFCPKTSKFGPKLALLSIAGSFGALLVGWLVVVARAVSRKTPIYYFFNLLNPTRYVMTMKLVAHKKCRCITLLTLI